jgi:hypothetical protein
MSARVVAHERIGYHRACELVLLLKAKGGPRCMKLLANGKLCGRPKDHSTRCMGAEAVAHAYAMSVLYHRERRAGRHAEVNAIKLARGCIDCGYNKHAEALDFDHNDPTLKIADVAAMLNHAWPKVLAELDKCVVRCACCHRVKTHRKPAASEDADGLSS